MVSLVNPFLAASALPYQLPPFEEIRDDHYLPAFEQGFREQLAEVDAIVAETAPATFENTIVALERSGQLLNRVAEVFYNKSSADSNDLTKELEEQLAPRFAAHTDAIQLNSALFARIRAVHEGRNDGALTAEQVYLTERYFTEYRLAGAGLNETEKAALRDYNSRLSTLTTRFETNLLADTIDLAVVIDDVTELDGLTEGEISAAAEAARERGLPGKHLVTLPLSTGHPYLAALTDRAARQRIFEASRSRGRRGNENDNRTLVLEITRLRAERAALLGFASHAAYVTADETARTPEAVAAMLDRLAPVAAQNARSEQAALQALADARGDGITIEPWDWAFYTELLRSSQYDVDTAALRPYFEAERVLQEGIFFAAGELYGLRFTERPELVAYHPDARVFEVAEADGTPIGLFLYDLYTRDSKRGGAWMNSLVSQSTLLGTPTIVVNNHNVPKPAAGSPTLLTLDEVNTLFHEAGHALHGLLARVTYPKASGTNVYRDFVEFPSQVNEMWMLWPEVVDNYARHYQTGEPLHHAVIDRIRATGTFNQGFSTSEYLAAALLDQAWHRIDPGAVIDSVEDFEAGALAAAGLDNPAVPSRYSSTYFAHTFSGGYDAGYYSYIWSEVLDADAVEWFKENGGLSRANGEHFRATLLGVGGSKDPLQAYRDFRGRDAVIEPLLARRGLN